jgi:hypothetical protein
VPCQKDGILIHSRYLLNDFSMTLATIITSLENFIDPKALVEGEENTEAVELDNDGDDENLDNGDGVPSREYDGENDTSDTNEVKDFEKDMRHVHHMFKALQKEFEMQFRKMWA